MDYIPVLFFGIGILYLLRVGYRYLSSSLYTAMAGGAVLCFVGGFYKATSKLIEASSGQCILALETSQFVMLAPGFVLLFISVLGLLKSSPSKGMLAVSGMEMWKIPFIAVMTLANLGFLVVLAIYPKKQTPYSRCPLYLIGPGHAGDGLPINPSFHNRHALVGPECKQPCTAISYGGTYSFVQGFKPGNSNYKLDCYVVKAIKHL